MAKRETRLVNRMKKAVAKEFPAVFVEKIHGSPYQRSGLPDLILCAEGHLIGIEVKAQAPSESEAAARGRVTPIQQACLDEMERAGATVGVALTVEEVLDLVRKAVSG